MKKYLLIGGTLIALVVVGAGCAEIEEDKASAEPTQAEAGKAEAKPEPPAQPAEPEMTSAQENAVESAESYLDGMAFSKKGLIGQLSSPAGEDFEKADATFAANHVNVDWNAEAVESAESYLDGMSFSKDGLIDQLTSSAGEGFTLAQAQYAVDQVY